MILDDPTPEKARALLERLPDLVPEDPALASVIADAMAEEFGAALDAREQVASVSNEVCWLANEDREANGIMRCSDAYIKSKYKK